MSTELDLDISVLVGEMEAPACESIGHEEQPHFHDDGPATHYARIRCTDCGLDTVKAYCATFTTVISSDYGVAMCFVCHAPQSQTSHFTILGPVAS